MTTKKEEKVFALPNGYEKCSPDAQLIATAILTLAGEVYNAADAIDALHQRLWGMENNLGSVADSIEGIYTRDKDGFAKEESTEG